MGKFYKTVIQITVLSEDIPASDDYELSEIGYQITEGDWSGEIEVVECVEVEPEKMAELLQAQGSDPSFFGLDDDF